MSIVTLHRFTNVGSLRAIKPKLIHRLLVQYQPFLQSRGVRISASDSDPLDYDGLARAFMNPDLDTPVPLLDALFYINEMATEEGMDLLLGELEASDIAIDFLPDSTPEDIAIQIWLMDREIVEKKHAEQYLVRLKSFQYFQSTVVPRPIGTIKDTTLLALEKDLDDWFDNNRRGRASRVYSYPKEAETWFLVRHGAPYKRESGIENGASTSIFYRPEAFDVVVYNAVIGEIRISSCTPKIKALYLQQFGRHLFCSDKLFPDSGSKKYTLEPLRDQGESSLAFADVEGIRAVRLMELHYYWGGKYCEYEIRKAKDLFAAFALRQRGIPAKARLVLAKFQIKFGKSKTQRILTIRPSNIASFIRDGDSTLVEKWLSLRGFVLNLPHKDEDVRQLSDERPVADQELAVA